MRHTTLLWVSLAAAAGFVLSPAQAAHTYDGMTLQFPAGDLDSDIDPEEQEEITLDLGSATGYRTVTGEGTWLTVAGIEGMGCTVISFNTATGNNNNNGSVNKIEATDANGRRTDFAVIQGVGNYEVGYNYGSYDSDGRSGVSGSETYHALGLIPGTEGSGTGVDTNMVAFDVSVAVQNYQVTAIGLVLCGRDSTGPGYPRLTITHKPHAGGDASVSTMTYGGFADEQNLFYGFQAPAGSYITSIRLDNTGDPPGSAYNPIDDLTYVVQYFAPLGTVLILK